MPANERVVWKGSFSQEEDPLRGDQIQVNMEVEERNSHLHESLIFDTDISKKSSDSFASLPCRKKHENFVKDAIKIILDEAVFKGTNRSQKVIEWMSPERLRTALDLSLKDTSSTHEELLQHVHSIIRYSVKTGHPRFVNQLYSSVDPYGLVGQWLTDALNPSVYTYEVSPVFTLMEEEVLREMRRLVGWNAEEGDGIFSPGGSISNGYAINIARHYKCPQIKTEGMSQLPRLVVFTSEDAHYSIKKLAAFLGIGTENVHLVGVDARGKMDVKELEKEVRRTQVEGAVPFMVVATAGTTVLGAFDPLSEIHTVCKKYDLWLHVDAAWGGGALLSRKHRHLLNGIQLADSVTWNPHKLLTAPQQCSTLLLKDKRDNILQSAHGANATYLFQQDKFYDTSYDSGDKHIQCGRKVDVLKFWFMWKAKGSVGLEMHVDRVFELSKYFTDLIRKREGWTLILEPECTNVCFWYTPRSIKHLKGEELNEALHKVAPKVKEQMVRKGSMLITYQPLRGMANFFRLVLQNSGVTHEDMDFFVEEIERLSENL